MQLRINIEGLLIIIVFVDEIIFGGSDEDSEKFSKEMKNHFEMSMISEMKYFLGLQKLRITM